jgi:dihydroflavonol-4-reductase
MTIFLTGATGFVGSAVLRRLLAVGHEVRVLARKNSDRRNIVDLPCEVVEGDLGDINSFKSSLKGCMGLFHVAADYRIWAPDPSEMNRINIDGTRDLLLAAAENGVGRIIYTSSVATLGLNADRTPSNEDTPCGYDDMIGVYKRSKFRAEAEVHRLVKEESVPVVIVNPSAPIGPRDIKPTPTGRIVVDAARGKMPAYVDTGLNVVHVEDAAEGHLQAYEKGVIGERYILGGENLTLLQILTLITKYVNRRPPSIKLPQKALLPIAYAAEFASRLTGNWEPFVTADGVKMSTKLMYFSSEKARKRLGYKSRSAQEAIADSIDWYRANGYFK